MKAFLTAGLMAALLAPAAVAEKEATKDPEKKDAGLIFVDRTKQLLKPMQEQEVWNAELQKRLEQRWLAERKTVAGKLKNNARVSVVFVTDGKWVLLQGTTVSASCGQKDVDKAALDFIGQQKMPAREIANGASKKWQYRADFYGNRVALDYLGQAAGSDSVELKDLH